MRGDYLVVAIAMGGTITALSYGYWLRSTNDEAAAAHYRCIVDEAQQFSFQRRGNPTQMILEIIEDRCLDEWIAFSKSRYWGAESNHQISEQQKAGALRGAIVKVLTTWQDAPKHPAIATHEEEEIALRKKAGPIFSGATHVSWDDRILWALRDAEGILLKIEERYRAPGMELDESEIASIEWGARILLDEMKLHRQ
jgi:hypothetical protein